MGRRNCPYVKAYCPYIFFMVSKEKRANLEEKLQFGLQNPDAYPGLARQRSEWNSGLKNISVLGQTAQIKEHT